MQLAKSIELKMREHKSRSHVNWEGALKQKGVKDTRVKQGLGVLL
jgi:hypothetical protein